jgi:hypothetical protein
MFALHAGAAYARVPDTAFEPVESLGGQDLFTQTSARESVADFVVLVSQRLWSAESGRVRAYASLGTGVRGPAKGIYFGGTAAFSRTFVTAGVTTALADRGVDAVPDALFRGPGDRTLFAGVERRRKWAFFVALSFGVVQ